ncbi:hypothetical protein GCG54_00014394 [Colletotrichum gloeosporioides]|uniref:Fungal N-terminal domain-containing protein n=1 Tax=Colletotrichum gloeosporioides TaxID=474922 RepID=A0A8H4C5G7_COLGL|nr:uncharacterized protein GCG54_00014394 [Colletotrichum gloeosporioides]KAF3797532.1 hypothetical protein GCG54_00014394 [Colletotrichum gloeosporioides]
MDPITIITAAASLAGAVLTASLKIKNTLDHLDNAPQNVCDIAEEIYAVQYALSQVEDVVRRDPNVIDRLALEDVFALAVKGCHATLLLIHKEYEQLFAKSDWKTKILVLWKDGEMTRLLGRLDRKKATLTLLTQTLNLRSTQDIKDLLIQNQSTLVAARQDSFETVPINTGPGAKAADPLEEDQLDSVYGDNESILSTTEFDFDFDLINTKTYRRALARAQAASRTPKSAPMNVDKPLPELVEEASPASLEPVAEEKLDDVTESISLSGETLASQYTLSRATTLLPEYEAVESSTLSPVSSITSAEKQVQSETNLGHAQNQVPAPQSTSEISLASETSKDEKDPKRLRGKIHRHASKGRLHQVDGDEKPHRRRPHGRPPFLKAIEDSSPFASSQSLPSEVTAKPEDAASNEQDGKRDKIRQRHKCGRRAEIRQRHQKGVEEAIGKVEDTMRQLSLADSPSLRRERGRRRQAA